MEQLSSKERMKIALTGGQPDRVPAAPDISNMVPCRLTGKPFWEVYVNENPALWKAYIDAIKYYGLDGWFIYGNMQYKTRPQVEVKRTLEKRSEDCWYVRNTYKTPDGDLTELVAYPKDNSPTIVEKVIKDFKKDFKKFKHFFPEITGYDDSLLKEQMKALGDLGLFVVGVEDPGLHHYVDFFHGNLEAATYAYYDYPDEFEELRELNERCSLRKLEMVIDAGVESVLTGGSGSITLQSPEIWYKYSFPTIKKITKICKEAGIISGIHCCGKEKFVIKTCAEESDLDYINPLEIPPMGDCSLSECKRQFGSRLSLMGNLHTTEVMYLGSPEDVRLASLQALLDAGENGGFVLSSGDQCGRDTPDENLFAMADVVREFGHYPLDCDRIQEEIVRLSRLKNHA